MLKRRYRLKSPAVFKRTLNAAKLCANKYFVVYGLKPDAGNNGTAPRFGFIVSTKVHKRATRRNKIKRWFREIIRRDVLTAPVPLPYRSVVVIARQGMLEAEYENVRRQLLQCLAVRG